MPDLRTVAAPRTKDSLIGGFSIMNVGLVLAFAFSALILYMCKGYEKTIRFMHARSLRNSLDPPAEVDSPPHVTVVIPTLNEADMIAKKLENLFNSDYPRDLMDVIVTDSSSDGTDQIASSYPVKVVKCNAKGKILAINKATRQCTTDIVVLTDCDTILDSKAIRRLVESFSDDVGAVGGIIRTNGNGRRFTSMKSDYHEWDWKLRQLEGSLDTVCSLDGNLVAFKTSIVREIPENSFADDMELTFLIRRKGYRCIICADSVAYQLAPNGIRNDVERMRRITKLTILTSLRYLPMLFSPKYGLFSAFIFPFRRFLNLMTPFLLAYIVLYLWLSNPLLVVAGASLALAISIVGFRKIGYYWLLVSALLLAWIDVFTGKFERGAVWKKVR